MEQKILAFMKENGIAVFAEADRATGAMLFQIPQTQQAIFAQTAVRRRR